jgi:hypothetical protein
MTLPFTSFIGCLLCGWFGGFFSSYAMAHQQAGYAQLFGAAIGLICFFGIARLGRVFEDRYERQQRVGLASALYFARYTVPIVLSFLAPLAVTKVLFK